MKKIILFTLLAFSLQLSFAQKDPRQQKKERKTERKTERKKSERKHRSGKKRSHYSVKHEQVKLYKAGKQKLENVANQYFDTTGILESNDKTEYTYDANGWLTVEMYKTWDEGGSQTEYTSKIEYTRDTLGNSISILNSIWNSKMGWVKDTKEDYNYTLDSSRTTGWSIVQYDGIDKTVPVSKIEYGYDLSDNLITDTYYEYDSIKKVYNLIDQIAYTYDAQGNKLTDAYSSWNAGTKKYDPIDKYFNSYDANNKMTRSLFTEWKTNKFVNSSKDTFAYDANKNMLSNTYNEWDALKSKWTPLEKIDNLYDAKNNQTKSTTQSWDARGSKWAEIYKIESSFDDKVSTSELILPFDEETIDLYFKTKLNQTTDYDWNKVSKAWVKNTNTIYNYKAESGKIIQPQNRFTISVYPNPSHDKIFIEVQNFSAKMGVNIYDMSGKLIQSNEMTKEGFININNLKSGVYLLQISDGQTLLGNSKLLVD